MKTVYLKSILILLLFLFVQQVIGEVIGLTYHFVASGVIEDVQADPALAQDMQWMLQQTTTPQAMTAIVGVGTAISSLAFILLMLVSRLAQKDTHRNTWQAVVWGLLLIVPTSIVGNVLVEATGAEDMMADIMKTVMQDPWGVLTIAVVAPVAEEVCYRAGILGLFVHHARAVGSPRPLITGLFIQALLFGGIHVNPVQVIFGFLLGLLIGWVYISTGSIWPCIAMHILNNSMAVVMTRCLPDVDTVTQLLGGGALMVCVCALCVGAVYTLLTRLRYIAPE